MSIVAAILLVAAQPAAASGERIATPAPSASIDPAQAVAAFRDLCIAHWRDVDALREALTAAPVPFAPLPRHDPSRPGESWRAGGMTLSYLPAGSPGMAAPQCTIRGSLRGGADQLSFAARVADALKLRNGATRTGSGQALTEWQLADPGGPARVLAMTRNAPGGGTELRLAILPAAP